MKDISLHDCCLTKGAQLIQGGEMVTEMSQMSQLKHFCLVPSRNTLQSLCAFWISPRPSAEEPWSNLILFICETVSSWTTQHPKVKLRDPFPLRKYCVTERTVREHFHRLTKIKKQNQKQTNKKPNTLPSQYIYLSVAKKGVKRLLG